MSEQSELYSALLALKENKRTGRLYVYTTGQETKLFTLCITVSKGTILDISVIGRLDKVSPVESLLLPIRSISFVPSDSFEHAEKTAGTPDIDTLLEKISGMGKAVDTGKVIEKDRQDLLEQIDKVIERNGLDRSITRGQIGLKAGVLMNFKKGAWVDADKLNKIRVAARDILGEDI